MLVRSHARRAALAAALFLWVGYCSMTRADEAAPPPLPQLDQRAPSSTRAYRADSALVLENQRTRVVFPKDGEGYGRAVWFAHDGRRYHQVGVTSPLSDIVLQGAGGNSERLAVAPTRGTFRQGKTTAGVVLQWEGRDSAGTMWTARLDFRLSAGQARAAVVYTLSADRKARLLRFTGPALQAGQGSFGSRKSFALFPGLEYLQGIERSSSRRDAAEPINLRLVPHPFKVTLPLMAVSHQGYLVALLWDQRQLWDGEHYTLSAQFASPNWHQRQEDHLMRLFVPTPPDWVAENSETARTPYELQPQAELRVAAYVVAEHVPTEPRAAILRAVYHYYEQFGVPPLPENARSLQATIELSRHGFMHTVWDPETNKSRHCVDWAPANSPGFATLLWSDYLFSDDPAVRRQLAERVELIAAQTIGEQGEAGLASPSNCHIMRWEFPFYYGRLAGGLAGARAQAYRALENQEHDGTWTFEPDEKRRSLGKFGDAVIGTCARPTLDLLKYARITGDQAALAAGLKGLAFMDTFAVPCGAQGWECPLYEPDLLASGLAVLAYVEAYRITGERRHLEQAVYWARTGLPFLYAWNRPDTPGMRYASIPVFGTTFYTHSWLGVPVQWNGLVYAYGLQHLAPYDSSLPWRHIAEGITISGTWQQIEEEGRLKGTYCDGWYEYCTDKRGAWINPEDIMVNLFALMGFDPDVSTAIVPDPAADPRPRPRVHISSGARVRDARTVRSGLVFGLEYFAGETSHALVTGVERPAGVFANGQLLEPALDLSAAAQGWQYDASARWLFIKAGHEQPVVQVRVASRP